MLVESIQSRHTSAGVRGLSLDSDRWDQPPVVFSNLVELTKYYRFIATNYFNFWQTLFCECDCKLY